ncbi:MAG: 4'-phosphopantetheinyl transferase superfamily protein [Chloroflexi bacterium]|nr:4'-phosphopantetheinyl transferase superfamily protein [Chloroflexota bacterium]
MPVNEPGREGNRLPTPEFSIRTGVDLVVIDEFKQALESGGETFLRRLFHPSEIKAASPERLAAVFAAKEAAYKALGLPRGDWHSVEVSHDSQGRPRLGISNYADASRLVSHDLSISHTGGLVVAVVTALFKGR